MKSNEDVDADAGANEMKWNGDVDIDEGANEMKLQIYKARKGT